MRHASFPSVILRLVLSIACIALSYQSNALSEQVHKYSYNYSNKAFEGKWRSTPSNLNLAPKERLFQHFLNDNGVVLISKYSHPTTSNNELIIVISLLDGKYKENWISITTHFKLKSSLNSYSISQFNTSDLEPIHNNEVLVKSYTLFKSNQRIQTELDTFELSYQGQKGSKHELNGVIELKEMFLTISFESKEIVHKGTSSKTIKDRSLFLFFLATIGFGQLLTLYNIIHQRYKLVGLNFQNVSKH